MDDPDLPRPVGACPPGAPPGLASTRCRPHVSRAMISRIERGEVHASAVVLDPSAPAWHQPDRSLPGTLEPALAVPTSRSGAIPKGLSPPRGGACRTGCRSARRGRVPCRRHRRFAASPHRVIDQHVCARRRHRGVVGGRVHRLAKGDCPHMRLDEGNSFHNPGGRPARCRRRHPGARPMSPSVSRLDPAAAALSRGSSTSSSMPSRRRLVNFVYR